ncbi:acyl carrier protein [Kitasatospora sp. LaBMicrA B282]|uniref:acyl carrier protein n=1 Tax=Kitasatospora sp. LaBMicrA B282 TaxID=3420949 RepID=UPI003D13941E
MAQRQTLEPAEIQQRITAFVRERFLDGDPKGELEETTPLLEWGVLNSLNTVVLLTYVRTELGVTIPPRQLNAKDLKNVRAIAAMVAKLAAAQAA